MNIALIFRFTNFGAIHEWRHALDWGGEKDFVTTYTEKNE